MEYLMNLPTDICNEKGLSKTLFSRRETIYLKHIMKNLFIYGTEEELNNKLEILQFKGIFNYIQFLTNKLRGIYKIPRYIHVDNANNIVKMDRNSIFKVLEMYNDLKPLIILDFDKTITNPNFHSAYNYLIKNYSVIINSANPDKQVILNYLHKNNLKIPNKIFNNKGKKAKIISLKNIAKINTQKPIFYIDDELEYLEYGNILGMYCYEYTRNKIISRTIFIK